MPGRWSIPDIYHSTRPGAQEVYGPGMSVNDRLQFGFPYPPLSLLLATIGYAIAHDHRYAQAAAVTFAGLFIGYGRPGRIAMLSAALLLFTPRVLFHHRAGMDRAIRSDAAGGDDLLRRAEPADFAARRTGPLSGVKTVFGDGGAVHISFVARAF